MIMVRVVLGLKSRMLVAHSQLERAVSITSCRQTWAKLASWHHGPSTSSLMALCLSPALSWHTLLISTSFCAGEKQPFSPAEGSQTFLQLTALCQDRTLVGMKLLDRIPSVPHGELSCSKSFVLLW